VNVRPKRLPFFKVGKELKERVNEGAGKEARPARANAKAMPAPAAAPAGNGNGDGVPQTAPQTTTGPVDATSGPAAAPGATRATA
jgi:hypothetical protein